MADTVVINCFPESARQYLSGYAIVAIDVIRATTMAITAAAAGRRCFPVPTLEAAFDLAGLLRNQPVPAAALPDGRKWIVEDCDIVSSFRYKFDGKLTVGEWLRSLRGIREGALWAKDDLFPMVAMLTADARDSMERVFRRSSAPETASAARWAKG
jgi:hypothetical protein